MHKDFADKIVSIIQQDPSVIGLAVGGSWLTNEIDQFSDLDLILITKDKISNEPSKMHEYANRFGKVLSAFTGEHVGEPRLLICLYDEPFLHVDIKFVTIEEFENRIENPAILYDPQKKLAEVINRTEATFPYPAFQWIEDRFWVWVHYGLLKIGRGEFFEAIDFLAAIRMMVLGPLLHMKKGNLPRGVRKVETQLSHEDFERLKRTLASYDKSSLMQALQETILVYRELRRELYPDSIVWRKEAELKVLEYFEQVTK